MKYSHSFKFFSRWPKFQIKMSDFNNYMGNKYPVYSSQKKVIESRKDTENNLEVQNIERSIKSSKLSDRNSDKNSDKSQKDLIKLKKLPRKSIVEVPKSAKKSSKDSELNSAKKQSDNEPVSLSK